MSVAAAGKSFATKFKDQWQFVTVLIAIAGTAITGYANFDETRDNLVEADAEQSRVSAALDKRVTAIEAGMLKTSDLAGLVGEDTLKQVACRQSLRSQRHEFLALVTAYEELIGAVKLAEVSFLSRTLSEQEERQLTAVIELRSRFESRKRDMEKEARATEERIDSPGGC